jgi:hypothetical protein
MAWRVSNRVDAGLNRMETRDDLSAFVARLTDWVKYKIESRRIDFENDAPYVQGLMEEIEGLLVGDEDTRSGRRRQFRRKPLATA